MRSVVYIEEDYIAGLLKDYFLENGETTYIVTDPAAKRHLASHGQEVSLPGRNNASLKKQLQANDLDILLVQSDDLARIESVLDLVRKHGQRVPTLVITAERDKIAEQARFVRCITMQDLLEGNLRWQMVLARTARSIERIREHFEAADSVLILLQDDPDPDAIASGLALRQVLGRNKLTATIGSFGKVTRPENIAMAKLLEIEVERITPERCAQFDRIALVDLQPSHIRTELPRIDLVVDHHPEQFSYETEIRDVRPDYGATATILLEYLLCMGNNVGTRLATALLYGIKSDTFLLGRQTNEWDVEAFSYVYPLANQNLLRRIERPELPPAAIDALGHALKTRQIRDKVAFVNLGRVEREDLIPQIADFCLQFEGIEWAVVSGIFESDLVVSVRNVGYVKAAGKVLKDAFGHLGSAGGHGSMAKAIIPLSTLCSKWKLDIRNTRLINEKLQRRFLRSLRSSNN
jgi:nanoRNase/pAp phosphatase (c-di-AMP/oligoRNAs hydrolase)